MKKTHFLSKLALIAALAGVILPACAQQDAPAATSLIPNGNFQLDDNTDGTPDGWGAPKGPLSYQKEGDNTFARLHSEKPGQTAMLYRLVPIPDGVKAVELTWKQRISEIKPGKQAWFDARIMMEWKDADGKKLKGAPSAPYARKDTDGWVDKSIKFIVPEGAKNLEFMPALFQVQAGTFDLDDITLKETDAAPVLAAYEERVKAQEEKKAGDAVKRDAKIAKNIGDDGNLMPNGDLQTLDKDGNPVGWGKPKDGSGISYETEDGNRFLRLKSPEAFKMVLMYKPVLLPSTVRAIQISWRERVTDIKAGKENYHDARIMSDFINAGFKKFKGGPALTYSKKATDGWVEKSKPVLVPEGAAGIALMPTLFMVEKGTYDLDDFKVVATDEGALLVAQAAAEAEQKRINLPYETAQPDKFPLALHVAGNQILDSNNKEVWLQGVNIMSLDWSPTGERILLSTKTAIEDWHANIIRLAVKEDYWNGKGAKDGGKAYRELVDATINEAANRGAYVLLDLHRYRAPEQVHADFWTDAATRYKNHPAVIFDLFNEPHGTSWEVWQKGGFVPVKKDGVDETAFLTEEEKIKNNAGFHSIGMQGLLDAVRATGAKNVVLAGGLDYGYDLSGVLKGYALDDKGGNGLVYGSHIYPWKHGWQKDFLDVAAKYPVLSGENGANLTKMSFIPADQQEDAQTWVPAFLGMVQKYHIHWTGFSFHPKASPILISDWNYTPTPEWGALAKRALAGEKFPAPDKLR